jgi:hypothetical protein
VNSSGQRVLDELPQHFRSSPVSQRLARSAHGSMSRTLSILPRPQPQELISAIYCGCDVVFVRRLRRSQRVTLPFPTNTSFPFL